MKKPEKKYDVFISYRRDGGDVTAKHLRDALTEKGYKVFLDVESLRNGPFNEALYHVIEDAKDFVLILPPNGLDRCINEKDWVRLEIEHAKACDKNIVPVMLRGFSFPKELPESIDFIRLQSGPPTMEISYFDAYVEKLQTFLTARPCPLWKELASVCAAVLLLCALAYGVYYSTYTYPLKKADQSLVSDLISFIALDMKQVDIAGDLYVKGLDRALEYVEGKTTDSEATIQLELSNCREEIEQWNSSIISLPEQLRQQLMTSNFDVGDLDSFKPALLSVLDPYIDSMAYLRDELLGSELTAVQKSACLRMMKEVAALDAEMLFYQINETLLPVTNDSALTTLKSKLFPEMPFIYSEGLSLTHNRKELAAKEDAVYLKYSNLFDEYMESIESGIPDIDLKSLHDINFVIGLADTLGLDTGDLEAHRERIISKLEISNVDPKQTLVNINFVIRLANTYGLDTSELESRRERILTKLAELEEKQQDVIGLQKTLEQKKKEAYEKFKPLPDDEQEVLWGKGKRFLTINMPEAAAECFRMYAQNGDSEDKLLGNAGLRFAENCTALGLQGGVVVGLYEENLPHQAVEIGDIIYEVDGELVHNYVEYKEHISAEGIHPIRILRFRASDYELLDSVIDTSLGKLGVIGLNDGDQ